MAKASNPVIKKLIPIPKLVLESKHGSVIVYTRRHVNGCKLDPGDNRCQCPKWLYLKPRGGKAVQRSAGTPSFSEACGEAQDILEGFDPKIAAALAITQPTLGITIDKAVLDYEASMKRCALTPKYIRNCLMPFKRRKAREYGETGRSKNMSLADWLDRDNLTAREPVTRLEQITSSHLDEWAATWKTNDLSSHIWRGRVATFLKWALLYDHIKREPKFRERQRVKPGNRCGYFSDSEIAKLYRGLPFFRMKGRPMPENYAERLGAFIDLGRWGAMSIIDIVLFQPKVSLGKNNVLTYRRHKNGQIASVLIDPKIAARLRAIPAEAGSSDADRPFRFPDTDKETNCQTWRYRFQTLCRSVGIREIETEVGSKKTPHPQMLRDTAAINAITHGVRLENVSKMLGHATITMTQRSYLFWVQKRIDHCIEDQRAGLASQAADALEVELEPDTALTTVN